MRKQVILEPHELGIFMRGLADAIYIEIPRAYQEAADEALDTVILMSSGTAISSKAEAKRLGHPFSKAKFHQRKIPGVRHSGTLGFDPAIINVWTGDFQGGWEKTESRAGGSLTFRIHNKDDKAPFLLSPTGTTRMVLRPLIPKARRRVARTLRERRRQAMLRIIK